MALPDAVEDVFQAALCAVGRAKGLYEVEKRRRAEMSAAEKYAMDQNRSGGSGCDGGGRGSLGKSSASSTSWRDASVPYLLSLQTLFPSDSDMVFRALQIVHERRITLLIGDKPSSTPPRSFPAGIASANSDHNFQEHTVEADAGLSSTGPWIDPSTQAPAATYFSVESERKGRQPYACIVPGLVNTGLDHPLCLESATMRSATSAKTLNLNAEFHNGIATGQGLCTCSEFHTRLNTEASQHGESHALYCKHILAVRLSQLQCWDGLKLRHVSSSNLGSWLASFEESATTAARRRWRGMKLG